jgi:hypothetical protein
MTSPDNRRFSGALAGPCSGPTEDSTPRRLVCVIVALVEDREGTMWVDGSRIASLKAVARSMTLSRWTGTGMMVVFAPAVRSEAPDQEAVSDRYVYISTRSRLYDTGFPFLLWPRGLIVYLF